MAWEFSRIRCSWGTAPFLACQKIQDIFHNADHHSVLFRAPLFLGCYLLRQHFQFPISKFYNLLTTLCFCVTASYLRPLLSQGRCFLFFIYKKLYLNLICRRVFLVQMKRSFNYYFLVWGFFIPSKKK